MRISNRRLRRIASLAIVCGVALGASGCGGVHAYRLNPTPEMRTTGQTPDMVANATTKTFDTNFRLISEDLGRLFMTDRPSRMHPGPKPY